MVNIMNYLILTTTLAWTLMFTSATHEEDFDDLCPQGACTPGPVCAECNQCTCTDAGPGCTKKACLDLNSEKGFDALVEAGCWRRNPSGSKCIFYSPCIDSNGPESCEQFSSGFCRECNFCSCEKTLFPFGKSFHGLGGVGGPVAPSYQENCPVDSTSCENQIRYNRRQGCYTFVRGECRFVFPCPGPESNDGSCECQKNGHKTCERCNKCECINNNKFCDNRDCTEDIFQDGCYVPRSFPGSFEGCYFISPCPPDGAAAQDFDDQANQCLSNPSGFTCISCASCPCLTFLIDPFLCAQPRCRNPKEDFCYRYNEERDLCEFISPCPQDCSNKDIICEQCNECQCVNGQTSCSRDKCPDPIATGCWSLHSPQFISPCPETSEDRNFCQNHPGERFYNQCNICSCEENGSLLGAICTHIACEAPDAREGRSYELRDGECMFVFNPFT